MELIHDVPISQGRVNNIEDHPAVVNIIELIHDVGTNHNNANKDTEGQNFRLIFYDTYEHQGGCHVLFSFLVRLF